jgi:hypothetical protein
MELIEVPAIEPVSAQVFAAQVGQLYAGVTFGRYGVPEFEGVDDIEFVDVEQFAAESA